ncbi:MAG: FAD-dependent oxidoreductase, partial [Atribacterota bacterium]
SGRRRPEVIPGAGFDVVGDLFILAIGQEVDIPSEGLDLTKRRTVKTNEKLETSRKGVFAGGDMVMGPSTLVESIAHGKRAAQSIDAHLTQTEFRIEKNHPAPLSIPWKLGRTPRVPMKKLTGSERSRNFREVELGYSEKEALAEASRCLSCGGCSECMQCVLSCQRNAIDHKAKDQLETLRVGAVIFATGAETFDPTEKYRELGYRKYPNVVTSLDFERILNASGPFQGHVVRPSDHRTPRTIGFIQCVGSRDPERAKAYCSSVCCMYAIKEALVAKEHLALEQKKEKTTACCTPGARATGPEHTSGFSATIFLIDMRAYGKDFEKYYERAKREGIRFIRGKVDRVKEQENGDVEVSYDDGEGHIQKETFELLVLSVGLSVSEEQLKRLEQLGLSVSPDGFLYTDSLHPIRTPREGIWVCGTL